MHSLIDESKNDAALEIQPILGSGLRIVMDPIKKHLALDMIDFENNKNEYKDQNPLIVCCYHRTLGQALGDFLALYFQSHGLGTEYSQINDFLENLKEQLIGKFEISNNKSQENIDAEGKLKQIRIQIKIICIMRGIEDFLERYIAQYLNSRYAVSELIKGAANLGLTTAPFIQQMSQRLNLIDSSLDASQKSDTKYITLSVFQETIAWFRSKRQEIFTKIERNEINYLEETQYIQIINLLRAVLN